MPPNARPYTQEMDRFSALSIYISLRAITEHPALYDECGADEDDRLLFIEDDYTHAGLAGSRMQQLRALNMVDLTPYVDELDSALRSKRMPCSLDDISTANLRSTRPVQQEKIATPSVSLWQQAIYNATSQPASSTSVPKQVKGSTVPMPAVDYQSLLPQMFPAQEKQAPQWSFFSEKEPVPQNGGYLQHVPGHESHRSEVPSWLLITLVIVCALLLVAVVVILILIVQRQAIHLSLSEQNIHSMFAAHLCYNSL